MTDIPARFTLQTTALDVGDPLRTDSPVYVYTGTLVDSSETVRIFTSAPDVSDDVQRQIERAFEEWQRLGTHPGISTVLASGDEPRRWIAVTNAGQSLSAVAPLSAERTRSVLADVAEALRPALALGEGRSTTTDPSQKVSVTPQHVRVVDEGGLLDWPVESEGDGPDEPVESEDRFSERISSRTPYDSPAPPDGATETSEQRAVFRLGAIAFEAVTGQPPTVGDCPSSVDEAVPVAFDTVVERALDPDPRERFGSLYEFKRALLFERSLERDTSPATPETIAERWSETVGDDTDTLESARETEEDISRRAVLGALGVGAVGAVAGGAWFTTSRLLTSETERFPTFRYDAANTGYAPRAVGPTEGVTEAWSVSLGREVLSSPVVDRDVVFASAEDALFAVDTADGTERWQADAGSLTFFGTTLGDGVVYLARREFDATGGLVALDIEDGEERWFEEGELFGQGTPVLDDDRVYSVGGNGLQAFELSERTVVWSSEEFSSTSLSGALVDETLYFAGSTSVEEGLVAVDTADGSERWVVPFDSFANASPAVADGLVVLGDNDGTLLGIDADDGERRWEFETDGALISSPAIASGTVYVGSGEGSLYAVDASSGEQQWRFETGGEIISSPAVVSETVYVGSTDANIYALDVTDGGDERWRFETDGEVLSSPAVVSNTVFIGSTDGYLYALTEPE